MWGAEGVERGDILKVILFPPVPLAIYLTPPLVCEESDVIPTLVSQRQEAYFPMLAWGTHKRLMHAYTTTPPPPPPHHHLFPSHSFSLFSVLARSAAVHLFTSSPYLKVPVSLCSARKMEWFNQWDRGEIRSLYRCKWCNAPRAQ